MSWCKPPATRAPKPTTRDLLPIDGQPTFLAVAIVTAVLLEARGCTRRQWLRLWGAATAHLRNIGHAGTGIQGLIGC